MPSDEQLELLALCRIRDLDWHFVAREAQRAGGLERLLAAETTESSSESAQAAHLLCVHLGSIDTLLAEAASQMAEALAAGAHLVTVLDDDYPSNLRTIFNLPPFLFYQGDLQPDDTLAVAVIGTRNASSEGRRRAGKMASLLAQRGVTVLSGLARGIDTVAHEAALAAGGRTVAVLGTGILKMYPPENGDLAKRIIATGGLVLSQFWPGQHPARYTFPRRNVVMSGLSQGSVVIEASSTSGAKMQARLALEHGRRVFLLQSLVEEHTWARTYVGRGAIPVETVDDVLRHLRKPRAQEHPAVERVAQLTLGF